MSVRIKPPAARHRQNTPGCFKSVALGVAFVALPLAVLTRRITRRKR